MLNRKNAKDSKNPYDKDLTFLITQYQVISDSRNNHNKILWEVPILFFAAQSFLIGLSFGDNECPWFIRALLAFLAFFFGILSLQIYERNRIMEIADAEQLLSIEKFFLSNKVTCIIANDTLIKRYLLNGKSLYLQLEENKKFNFLNRKSSYLIWKLGLYVLMCASFLAFFYQIFEHCFCF